MKGGMAMIVPNETDQHNTERKKIMKKDELKLLKMSDIQVREVDWLWYPYIPFGKLTIIHGDPKQPSHSALPPPAPPERLCRIWIPLHP